MFRRCVLALGLVADGAPPLARLAEATIGDDSFAIRRYGSMRLLIALLAIIYIVGVGVVLSPTIETRWKGASASDLASSVARALPDAIAWPVTVYHGMTGRG